MYPEIEVRQLRCVIAVADELHFTRAAQKLHITQSALTRQIRHLELQLGVDLFIRGTRHVEPTDAGRALVEDGRKALVLMDRGVRRALGAGRGDFDVLRLAYSPFVDIHFFSQLRAFLAEARPELQIEYSSEVVADQIQGLIEGRYHVGIGPLAASDAALSAVCLFQEAMFVVFRKGHRLARKRLVHVSELGNDPVIWMPRKVQPTVHDDFLAWCRSQGYVPNVVQEVTSVSEILDFVAEGAGVGFVKASACRLHEDGLAFCPIGDPPYLVSTGILYRTDNRSQLLRNLVTCLAARFPCATIERRSGSGLSSESSRPSSQ